MGMALRLDVYLHLDGGQAFAEALAALTRIEEKINTMADTLAETQAAVDAVTASVAVLQTTDDSAIALLNGINDRITAAVAAASAAGATPEQLQALNDLTATITSKTQALADAVTQNTPAVPEPRLTV